MKFNDSERARVYVVLTANDGNVKRTARETGVPESTVRRWKKEFETNPPDIDNVEVAVGDFVETAERVRWLALEQLEKKLRAGDASVRDLTVLVGVATDKLDRARGVAAKVEHVHSLPSADELRGALSAVVEGMIEAATTRQDEIDIIDGDWSEVPPAELPVSTDG